MNAIAIPSARFALDELGNLWTWTETIGYDFWTRLLDVYDEVYLLARAKPVRAQPDGTVLASGPAVHAMPLPFFQGPFEYASQSRRLHTAIRNYLANTYAVHLRVPLTLAPAVISALPDGYPYGVEVVGDPYDVFAPGSVRHPLRVFFRWWFTRHMRRQCAGACAAAYVTSRALQQRYPPNPNAFTTHYSSIDLYDDAFAIAPRLFTAVPSPARLILVGSLEQLYKSPDVLIAAVACCVKKGLDLHLTLVGDGRYRSKLEAQVAASGLNARVTFTGKISVRAAVREQLDQADLFVLPSRQEGLPRAMLEAMARGLPCIGSTVGGIPELLPPEDTVAPNDIYALAMKIREVVTDPERLSRMAARNLAVARAYHNDILRKRRIEFYQFVKMKTEEWIKRHSDIRSDRTC